MKEMKKAMWNTKKFASTD